MPDPTVYLQAMATAFVVSVVVALCAHAMLRNAGGLFTAATAGTIAGCVCLQLRVNLPPVSALDRFFTLVLPAVLIVEFLVLAVPVWLVMFLRAAAAVTAVNLLLQGSVYVSGGPEAWTVWVWLSVVGSSAGLLTGVRSLLQRPGRGDGQISTSLGVAAALLAAGVTIMLAGYLKGGSVAFPFAAAVAGSAVSCPWMSPRASLDAVIQSGTVTAFSLLFIGCFFGAVPVDRAIAIFLAPVCCHVTALPWFRQRPGWQTGTVRVLAACLPLVVVLTLAVRDFRVRMAPLL